MNLSVLSIPKIGAGTSFSKTANFAAPIGAIVVSLAIFFLIAWPKFTEVLKLRAANNELTARSVGLDQKAQDLASLNKEELELELTSAENLLPSDKEVFSLVAQVENSARLSGVLLSRLETAPGAIGGADANITAKGTASGQASQQSAESSAAEAGVPKIQLKISLVSDYKSYLQFLNSLLSLSRVVAIRDLTINSSSTAEGSSQLRTSLTLDAYWQSLPRELASIESPIAQLTPEEAEALKQIKTAEQSGPPVVVPSVPLGRTDLFAPF